MFHVLQALRFGFAVMIFLHHVELFEAGGSCGVSFFLLLSGFVMSRGYAEKVAQPGFSWRHYMGRRILRLWPLHLVCLLVAVAVRVFLYGEEIGGWWWLPNLCLLQSWLPYPHIYFSGNAVSWCLSDLLFFYALFRGFHRCCMGGRSAMVLPFPGLSCSQPVGAGRWWLFSW